MELTIECPSLLLSIYSKLTVYINKVNPKKLIAIMVFKFFIWDSGRVRVPAMSDTDTRHGYRVIPIYLGMSIGITNLAKIGYEDPRVTRFATLDSIIKALDTRSPTLAIPAQ